MWPSLLAIPRLQGAAAGSSLLEALRAGGGSAAAAAELLQPAAAGSGSGSLASLSLVRHFVAGTPAAAAATAPAAAAEPAAAEGVEELLPPAIPLEQQQDQGLYRDLIVPVYNLAAAQVGSYTLGGDIFDVPIRRDILHRVVRWQLAKRQQGTHLTKGRSEVRGGGRKPRPQKGSGQSRQGTIRAPQW